MAFISIPLFQVPHCLLARDFDRAMLPEAREQRQACRRMHG
jgi:hypothetical protein